MSEGLPADLEETVVHTRRQGADGVVERLRELGWRVAIAESLTGGAVTSALVGVPGASEVVRGGVVAYATDIKMSLLGVDRTLLDVHGAVNPRVATQMAEGVRTALGDGHGRAQLGISTTGIAGPTSPDGQPVGTVHIGISTPLGTRVESALLTGDRDQIRTAATELALRCALSAL